MAEALNVVLATDRGGPTSGPVDGGEPPEYMVVAQPARRGVDVVLATWIVPEEEEAADEVAAQNEHNQVDVELGH